MPASADGFVRLGDWLHVVTLGEQDALVRNNFVVHVRVSGPLPARFPEEDLMNSNKWIRQTHRWVSIAFTVAVIINIAAMGQGEPVVWVGLLALFPLILLLLTGLYLFVLPYAARWRGAESARARG